MSEGLARPRSAARLAAIGAAALAAFAVFVSLGIWQIERRDWKLGLIERVEARIRAAPSPPPGREEWPEISDARDGYRRVRLDGAFEPVTPTLVTAATEHGSGYWALAPYRTRDGFVVLVNRGFVPQGRPAADFTPPPGPASVTGLLRLTEPGGAFLRSNDPKADRWHSRDVAAIAEKRGLIDVAPYFVDADATPNPGGFPIGGLTVIAFRNNHLVYALTWFGLAAMVLGGAAIFVRHEWRLFPSSAAGEGGQRR